MSHFEIMENKLASLLDNRKSKVIEVVDKIEHDSIEMNDAIVPFGRMSPLRFQANGKFNAVIDGAKYDIHQNAITQIATKFGVPTRYANNLIEHDWGRELLANIFTEHNDNSAKQHMLVRSVDQEIRGVLSDKYRRLDSQMIYGSFITKAKEVGAEFIDAHYSPVKSYITVIFPKVYKLETENNGTIATAFGARIRNSDFGQSSLAVNAFQLNVVCNNGLVAESALSVKHLGKRLSQNLNFSKRTYELDTRTMASAVKDITVEVLSEERILETCRKIKAASAEEINMDNAIKKLDKIHKHEQESILKLLQDGDPGKGIEGKPTKWKLSQAITAHSNEVGGTRKQELDEIAGKLLNL